jgi:hypothetical protein
LLLLTIFALLMVAAGGPIRQAAAEMQVTLPPDYDYYPPEWQQQYQEGFAARQGFVFHLCLPGPGCSGTNLDWVVPGWQPTAPGAYPGWQSQQQYSNAQSIRLGPVYLSFSGISFRLFTFSHNQAVASPGLSGFIPLESTGFRFSLRSFLSLVDIYLIWYFVLLLIGVRHHRQSLARQKPSLSQS